MIEYGRLALQVGINEKEALIDLENQVNKYLDTVAAEILANYYEKKSSKKAKKYLYIGNKKAFFNYLLKNNDEYSYIYYYEKLTVDEKLEIDSIKEDFEKEKIIDLYLQRKFKFVRTKIRYSKRLFWKSTRIELSRIKG